MASPYREGQFFLVPLQRGLQCVGLIARVPPRGGVLLGYFFGPRRKEPPPPEALASLTAEHAAFVCRFKDVRLYRGEWRLLCAYEPWRRSDWPLPAFHRHDGVENRDWRVEYADDNLVTPVRETEAQTLDLHLVADVVFDPTLLVSELDQRVSDAVPGLSDDGSWR